jgi:hypothetical protein
MNKLSKDEALENAIINSMNNPWHCLYFKDPSKPDYKIAITLINSNETYELDTREEYKLSIHAHEQFHVVSTIQTQFKRFVILYSIQPHFNYREYSGETINISIPKYSNDLLFVYTTEVVPFLEAFALFTQCRMQETPTDFKNYILSKLARDNPSLYGLVIELEDIIERIFKKGISLQHGTYEGLLLLVANLILSTPNIIENRVFDRYRLLREIKKIPEWGTLNEISKFLREYFNQNNFSIVRTTIGTPEGIISAAEFLRAIKNVKKEHGADSLELYLFGILSEIDARLGHISFTCDSLETLEGKRIDKCYMGQLAKDQQLLGALNVVNNNINELIANEAYKIHKDNLTAFKEDIMRLIDIKRQVFQKCPGPDYCRGKSNCLLRNEFCEEIMSSIFRN